MIDFSITMKGWTLAGTLHPPAAKTARGLAVIAHGLYSDKSSIKLTALSQKLSEIGLAAARFDAMGCGQSSGRFSETTLTGRAEAVAAVAERLRREYGRDLPLWLIGSSFGGSAALLLASRDASAAGVVAWSAPNDFAALTARLESGEESDLDRAFFDDLTAVDMPACLTGLSPVLLVHAQEDEVVPVSQAYDLLGRLGPDSKLVVIFGSDHAFHAPGASEIAIETTLAWLERRL